MPKAPHIQPIFGEDALPRRRVLACGAAFLLAGCADVPVLANAVDALRFAVIGAPDPPMERAAITKLPYASMSAKIGKGARGMLVLGRYDGEDLHWIAGTSGVIVTRNGRVVKTSGLPVNLKDTRAFREDPVATRLHRIEQPADFVRYVDLEPGHRYDLPIRSRFETVGRERITIAEIEFDTVLVREINDAATFNWKFENLYWADIFDGFVWKSRQHVARGLPPLDLEVLKPAA
jgi:hypothetical protein